MANDDKASLKEAKKQERAAKRAQRKQNWSQMWQAFNMQRKQDKALIPIMLAAFLGMGLLFFLIGMLFNGEWFMLILGLGIGAILAMFLFTRRLERDMYKKVEDQPGAAGWALEQQLRNTVGVVWKVKTGVAATRQQDLIHRVIGNSGVIFVVEGDRKRVGPTLNRLKKRVDRMAGGVPVYEVFVGNGEDEVPVSKLRSHIMKLPRNYNKNETYDNIRRIEAMDDLPGTTPGLPKGPMPRQAQNMAGMNRRMRRMQERKGGK
ncbi:DUF4191 domain-containing protein [Corynebacterium aurimucosum]|uniref:DUF4191 domain-containing protein n=2 Tax=Corynebacterium TaxID=1716 RepID=A0ABU9UIK1_9CORY|nr:MULTISPECIES: DUF4191 domain-containing protein [Corynebacterium]MCG7261625.1 DUF4191 domain-containing protein [Corynebacterium aurimucosum]MCL8494812.1 DUF4191 domain-containing protein [Corynebacterium intestinale]MCP1391048.1 DUF4191 domain-containing protein [Corynebacterium intestinale]MCZ9297224.1 DUF4191 domain-containing protein [Corynebacterium hesseae]MDK6806012.1 DUF4191 domain-containing protein [Corynebacterium aurimucosum]